MTSASFLKKLSGSGRFGKVAKIALGGDCSSRLPVAALMFSYHSKDENNFAV